MAPLHFSRLIRFRSSSGKPQYAEPILASGQSDSSLAKQAKLIELDQPDNIFAGGRVTDKTVDIPANSLLSPLPQSSIGTVRCLGLNYANHAKESNMPIPKHPILFYKPQTSVSGTGEPIKVSGMFLDEGHTLDYECELVVVIGKECKNVTKSEALDYVLGYTAGNDVSHREWQLHKGSGWDIGKGADTWAPIGPCITSATVITDPQKLRIGTKVNGKVRQDNNTADMIFGVAETVAFLSQGTTLMPGDLIFTGTPEGVGQSMKPAGFLKNGDEVEVFIENIGTIRNKVQLEKGVKAKL